MKSRKEGKELDVDFVGGMGPLTDEDRKVISAFIQERKKKQAKKNTRLSTSKSSRKKNMKKKQLDLDDIGFVGGGRPMTEEDTKAFSAWIQARKKQQAKKKTTRTATPKKSRKTT